MAEEPEDQQAAPAADESGASGGRGGMLGPALALLVTLVIGLGLGGLLMRLFNAPAEAPDEEQRQTTAAAVDTDDAQLLKETEAMRFEDVLTNLRGELSRYIKVNVDVWFNQQDPHFQEIMNDPRIRRVLQEQMIEVLRNFDEQSLSDDFVLEQIKRGFQDRMDRELRRYFGEGSDRLYVRRIIISDFILQ